MSDYGAFKDLFAAPRRDESRIYGVVVGIVTNNQDDSGLGRVKVRFPWLSDADESNWARVATPMAGKDRGVYFLPEVDDEVLVMFEHGRVDSPFVVGALWNGEDTPPADNADGKNNVRIVKSRSGHTVTLDDTEGSEKITIADGKQKSTIVFDAAKGALSITSEGDFTVKVKGKLTLESDGDVAIKGASVNINDGKLKVQ
ncbi:phage baseplate assembly protein V [Sorangium sp. So ce375]|uniref:phage baseplate assembly protein V n=1 Tax=Sorangium sp. So ce375 TaxID=3133306 RepID=UPI003F5B2313